MTARPLIFAGACLGLTSVMLGAAADHARSQWGLLHRVQVALHYQQLYAVLIVALGLALAAAGLPRAFRHGLTVGGWLFVAGSVLFCGGLYATEMAPVAVYLAPVGGVLLMMGWFTVGISAVSTARTMPPEAEAP